MSGNRDELPDRTTQRETTTRSDQLDRRQQVAEELGVAPETVAVTETADGVETRLTDRGRQQAEQTLAQRFASERPNVRPTDVRADVDPDTLTGRAEIAADRRDAVADRVAESVAEDNEITAGGVSVSVGAGGVEDVDVDARELAIQQAASQSEQFDADDFRTVETDDGVGVRLTDSARERATEQQAAALRQEAADQLDAFGSEDIVVEETDSGLSASVEDSALREQVIDQAQSSFEFVEPSREDISVSIGEDGASATIAEAVRREEARQQAAAQLEAFDASDITLTETDSGGFEASVPDEIQRETVREQAAADLDNFGPEDITVEETDDGFQASVRDSAQRQAVRDQAASELEGFDESDIRVEETADGFRAEVTDSARRREVREELFSDVPDDLGPVEQFANPATGEITRVGFERAENAFESGDLEAGDFQQVFEAFQSDQQLLDDDELADVPTRDPDDVTVAFEPQFETRTVSEGGEQRQIRERVGEQAEVELTDEAQAEREQLLRENLRESAAEELDQFGAEDIQVTETDNGLQAEVEPRAERDFLLNQTSETLFVTAAGGDTVQAALDLRPNLESIPGRSSINAALEASGSDLRSTAPVGEILTELDPEEVAEWQDDLGITPEQVRAAQQGIEQERQEAQTNPDAFVAGVDDYALTDALRFDQATERGSERRSQLRQRADEIEQEVASSAGVDADEVTLRATVDGLEATEETERTIARGRAAQQFGVDASNVVVEESGDGFEASLEADFAEQQALEQAAAETGIDVGLLDAEASGGTVDVGIDRDALRQSVAEERGVSADNIELRETDSGIQAGVSEEVREAQIEQRVADSRDGVDVGDVDVEAAGAFSDSISATVSTAAAATDAADDVGDGVGNAIDPQDVRLTREQAAVDAVSGGRFAPVVDAVEGRRQSVAESIETGARDLAGAEDVETGAQLTGEQEFLNDLTGGAFGEVAGAAEDVRAEAADVAGDVGDTLVRGATFPARLTAGAIGAGADAVDDITPTTDRDIGAEAALGAGIAGIVTPEPTTSVGGAALAAGAAGVLAADAVRRSELEVPDTDELLTGSGAEIETPQRREPLSEIEAPTEPTQGSEIDVGEQVVEREIDVPDDTTPGVTEVGVPAADTSAVIDETPVNTPGINQPDIDEPTIEQPETEFNQDDGEEFVEREPFVFPGNQGAETDVSDVEQPAVEAPASSFETDVGTGATSGIDVTSGGLEQSRPDVAATAVSGVGTTPATQPRGTVRNTLDAAVTANTPSTSLTVDGLSTGNISQTSPTAGGSAGTNQARGRPREDLPLGAGSDAEPVQSLVFDSDTDEFDSGLASAEEILNGR